MKVGDLYKQGTCKKCFIPLFGYKNERRYLCGDCAGGKGNFARKINDYVVVNTPISEQKKVQLMEAQIDDLKREVALWKEKYDNKKTM